jgi:citrate lyase subunit beta/citryl-CoA lyase
LEKAVTLGVDEIVIDLEDSVPAELKAEAREAVGEALVDREWTAATVSARVNGVATPWFEDDMRAIAGCARLDSVIVPKVESVADLKACEPLLEAAGRGMARKAPIGLQALIESAVGLQAAGEIAAGSPRLESLILGPADMSVALGFPSPEEGPRWDFVRGEVLIAARAAGLQAIDGPFLQISDLEGLVASAERARDFGFDGKWALHPAQVEPINEAFSARPDEVSRAEAILEALDAATDGGAVMLDGEMIDEASRKRAMQILARAKL